MRRTKPVAAPMVARGLSARQHRRAGLGTPRGDHYGREGRRLLRRRHLP